MQDFQTRTRDHIDPLRKRKGEREEREEREEKTKDREGKRKEGIRREEMREMDRYVHGKMGEEQEMWERGRGRGRLAR